MYELWAGERLVLEKALLGIGGLGAQFQCRLFHLVQALMFGALAGSCLAELVPIIAGFGTLDGKSVVWTYFPAERVGLG